MVQYTIGSASEVKLKDVQDYLPRQLIYDKLDEAQVALATDLLCVEKSATLTVSSSSANVPSGFFRAKFIVLPSGQVQELVEVSIDEFDHLDRSLLQIAYQTPLFFKKWNGVLTFFPDVSSASYTFYYYGIPTTSIANGTEPETTEYLDRCLIFWAVKELAPIVNRPDLVPTYEQRYASEKSIALRRWQRTKSNTSRIVYHDV